MDEKDKNGETGGKIRNIRRWRRKREDGGYERRTKDV
jgi:hypothetical protein